MPAADALEAGLLRVVLDALPVGVIVLDANGDIVLNNREAERGWGSMIRSYESRLTASQGWWHATGERVLPHEWASVRALVEGIETRDQIVDIASHDGTTRRTIRNSAVPLRGPDGSVTGAVILNEDITDRVQLEARLVEAEKLEAVGRLAGGVAHDFNNLLMVIHAYSELLHNGLDPEDPLRNDVNEVQRASESAADLTRQLLAFGRRESRHPRPVELETLVRDNEKLLRRAVDERVTFVVELASPGHTVLIDPTQVQQILLNLVLNARDAMPEGGTITISTRLGTGTVVLAVLDTGTGMEEHVRARIFEPFYTTKARSRGTGLGLSTVYGIVQRAGGTIRVDTSVGRGTTFEVELPLCTSAEPAAHRDRTSEVPRGSESVLLVEDAAPVRVAVSAMLASLGYRVHAVTDAAAALAYVSAGGVFDIVITDVIMPGQSGPALVARLRSLRPETRVLFISGYTADNVTADAPLLMKPFRIEALAKAVRNALASPPTR